MSFVQVVNVALANNPAKFTDTFQFDITFECLPPGIQHELEWKLIYVGSATDEKFDQELDAVIVGPVVIGKNKFNFTAPPPDHTKIPVSDLLEVTVLLLTCSYQEHEFIRIGYYVNNEMELTPDQQKAIQALTEQAQTDNVTVDAAKVAEIRGTVTVDKLWRNILTDKPRVTRFNIPWDKPEAEEFPELTADEKAKFQATVGVEVEGAVIGGQNENGEEGFDTETLDSDEEGEDEEAGDAEMNGVDNAAEEDISQSEEDIEGESENDEDAEGESEADEADAEIAEGDAAVAGEEAKTGTLVDVTNTAVSA